MDVLIWLHAKHFAVAYIRHGRSQKLSIFASVHVNMDYLEAV